MSEQEDVLALHDQI